MNSNFNSNKDDNITLRKRIYELELLIKSMNEEKTSNELLSFPWIGNLGHWYWMVNSNQIVFNKGKIEALGYKTDEIPENIGYDFFTEKLHKDDYDMVMDNMRNHLYGQSPAYEVEYRIKTKSGDFKWFYDRGKISKYDTDGKPLIVAGIVFDITQQKQLESDLKEANRKLQILATYDSLTGILNRRMICDELKKEMARAKRYRDYFCLIMFDIDHFKKVNDTYGHMTGDLVLQQVVHTVSPRLRVNDSFGRWGGEEFLIVLRNTQLSDGVRIAEDIRVKIEKMHSEIIPPITASFGVSEYKIDEDTADSLTRRADYYMYQAKNSGRNCTKYNIDNYFA